MSNDSSGGRWAPIVLMVCLAIIGGWLILARYSARPWDPFRYTSADFVGFKPASGEWFWREIKVANDDPTAINLVVLVATPREGADSPGVLVRLVHGYNMPMCMRIKGFTVEPIRDARDAAGERVQLWRLISDLKEPSVWATRMLQAETLADSGRDIRDLAFPRVATPDDPRWAPEGIGREFLRHPWDNFRRMVQVRWNAARTDWRTFLRWRRPAWVSDEELTLVATGLSRPSPETEEAELGRIQAAQREFLDQLRAHRRAIKGDTGVAREDR